MFNNSAVYKYFSAILITIFLIACGGGDSGTPDPPNPPNPPNPPQLLTGIITDSPIQGIHYLTSTGLEGDTDTNGNFQYKESDLITFSLASIKIPEIDAKQVITPFELFNTIDVNDNQLVNFIRLIQTLDDDGDISDRINITTEHKQALADSGLTSDDLALSESEFNALAGVSNLLDAISHTSKLVSKDEALDHFLLHLANSDVIDLDNDGMSNSKDDDDDNDGVLDIYDDLPWNPAEYSDLDGDWIGDISDPDDDNDGILDDSDSNKQYLADVHPALPTISDYQYNYQQKRLYLTHKSDKSLSIIDLRRGSIKRTLNFAFMPERMTLSPDGSKLYVALLVQEHSSYWWEAAQSGYIAVIDTHNESVIKTLSIKTDPYDLVVTSKGKLVVSSGSGQWTSIFAYNADTGAELGKSMIRQASRLSLHPSENWVFAADTDSSPSDIEKFDISGTGITSLGDSPYHGTHRMSGNVWATPDGKYVITRGGDIFYASDMTYIKSLTDIGVFIKDITFDQYSKTAMLLLSTNEVLLLNMQSLESIDQYTVTGTILSAASYGHHSYYLVQSGSAVTLTKQVHPCETCATNTAPVASFSYTPLPGDTTDTFTFDASASNDDEDGSLLYYRWDIDNDGVWDTAFNTVSTYQYKFIISGTKYVRLQVKDSGGLTHSNLQSLTVEQGIDYGIPVTDSVAFQLDFTTTDVEVDKTRSKAYITDKGAKRVYIVDLVSGKTEKYFEFDFMPERMTLSPDGSKLYVALLVQEHSSYWWDEYHSGYIAIFDTVEQAHINTHLINTDPYDLVVTSGGKLIVSSGSGQWTNIFAYNADTGAELGKSMIRQASRLSLHPSENWVFAADTDSSPSDIEKFDISGTGISSLGDSPYHGTYRMSGNVWATPDETYVITRGGDIFLASDMTYVDSLTAIGVSIVDISFNVTNQTLVYIGSDKSVYKHNLSTWIQTGIDTSLSSPQFILETDENIQIIDNQGASNKLVTATFVP